MNEHVIVSLAGIGLLAILCQWLAWWLKLPAILFLLLVGVAAGPLTGWLDPDAIFGELLVPFVSLSVAVILFEGSLTLRFDQIRGLERVVRNLITSGLLVTWVVTALATRGLLGFSWQMSFLFGAIVVVTGPTVVVPMLRAVRPSASIANILRWEGIVIDPIGALLAVLVFNFIISGQDGGVAPTLITFGRILLTGALMGAAAGYFFGVVLRNHWLPEFLHNVATLCFVFTVFTAANLLEHESGLLAVTVMGLWLGNMKNVPMGDILDFKESLSVLLISGLFIILAARIEFAQLYQLGWAAIGVLAVMQFVARPLKILVSTIGSSLKWRERAMISWIAPRGIVAAAVSAVFAPRLQEAGYAEAALIVPLTFIIIIGTVVIQSATSRPLANALKVSEPEPKGLLIIGANRVARAIADALRERGFRTLLADTSWENVRAARMEGLSTYFGNPVSQHADRHLDLVGIGGLLALSPHTDLNALATLRYRSEFGESRLFALAPSPEKSGQEVRKRAAMHRGSHLFAADATYGKLASLLGKDAEIRATQLTGTFGFADYLAQYGSRVLPLFAIDSRDRLHMFTVERLLRPDADWTVIGLIQSDGARAPGPTKE